MTKEENIATLNEHLDHWKRLLSEKICDQDEGEKTIDALQNAIKALEQESTDAVDRVTIKEYLSSCEVPYQKIGTWRTVKRYVNYYQCTYCSKEIMDDHSRGWNYCPFCGAKMSDVEDKNET